MQIPGKRVEALFLKAAILLHPIVYLFEWIRLPPACAAKVALRQWSAQNESTRDNSAHITRVSGFSRPAS